ncbi:DNA-processing protein DprA [Desulfosediminicola flagellatus]|uniref:DNA-processing protein DprA n=1 Tax=Desulfosediminicola flagellatus TaxID=2569541 RepID=UPI0010AD39D4|nr:DNA-processing protein DprA [Desulfosediminicola flagellatus]
MENSTLSDWVCLSLLPGIGPAGLKKLLAKFKSPRAIFEASRTELESTSGIRVSQLGGFESLDSCMQLATDQIGAVNKMGGSILCPDSDMYPDILAEIHDPPVVLYALGDLSLINNINVAIVGSRSATTYGRRVAFSFAKRLSENGVTVVSGMALGIDSESHAGALQFDGGTIAVLGCGIDVVYPRQNSSLYKDIKRNGLILSEYPLGTRPEGFRFPARNRIIAGISRGIVVVEAARKSGSLITAQMGLDFGRDIFAVPGQIDSCKSEGTHWLLQQGAQLVASADDILREMNGFSFHGCSQVGETEQNVFTGLDPDAIALMKHLEPYAMLRDEVTERAGLSPARISELFLFLELEGHIEILPGDQVRKVTM